MYQVFATSNTDGTLYIGILAGEHANEFGSWMRNDPGTPDNISIQGIPVICFMATAPTDFQVASWTYGCCYADRTVSTRWSWGRGKNKLPPQPTFTYRMFQLGLTIGPRYRCVGLSNTGVPQLDLEYCAGDGSHWILCQAQIVQIAELLQDMNGDKRKFDATFPTDACHLHDHNHEDRGDDDSPPPQGKRIRTQ